jgi:predicted aldo/keto reductase-like oxidoreductase
MKYNVLGNTGIRISALSFGTMRWASEQACHQVIHRGIELGMNYVDTSTGYVGGRSETWCGNAVRDRRDKVYFSSKSNWAQAPSADGVRRAIEGSLRKTGLDYFDFYQIWGLQRQDVLDKALSKGGTVEGVRRAQRDGLIRHGLGFTFHGDAPLFKAAVDSGEFVSATVSYNLAKRTHEELLDYAADHGVGIVIMNPLAGGVLAKDADRSLDFLRDGDRGPWYGGLRFLLANPSITTAIVGYREASEVDQNVQALEGVDALDEGYRRDLAAKMAAIKLVEGDFCTGCGYCRDCPNGFNPTRFMIAIRDYSIYGSEEGSLTDWLTIKYIGTSPEVELANCIECGECEQQCPQHLNIVEEIRLAKEALGK